MKKIKLFLIMMATVLAFTLTACGGNGQSDYNYDSDDEDDSEYTENLTGLVTDGEYVSFGEWPQTIKASSVTVNESEIRQAGAYTYYKGSDGAWYAKCLEMAGWDDYRYSNGNTANRKEAYCERYFKVEPIKWRVLTHDYNGTGKALLLANKALINSAFYEDSSSRKGLEEDTPYSQKIGRIPGSDYMHSRIRAFLNGKIYYVNEDTDFEKYGENNILKNDEFVNIGFLQTAFTEEEQEYIAVTTIVNDAENANPKSNPTKYNDNGINEYTSTKTLDDKIFLLSLKEATDTEYGFVGSPNSWVDYAQIIYPTDFAIANGIETVSEERDQGAYNPYDGTEWWLRSPNTYGSISTISTIGERGFTSSSREYFTGIGVVPALCIDLSHCTPVEGDVNVKAITKSTDPDEAGIPMEEMILDFTGTPYQECGTKSINNVEYKLVQFGDFPQTKKITAVEIIEKLQAKVGDYTYYLGNDSNWYAKIDSSYYKVEPIVWRVLTENYDHDQNDSTPGKKLLLAEKILMNRSYYDFYNVNRTINGKTVYPNNYEHSRIRAYLNGYAYLAKTPDEDSIQSILDTEWNYGEEYNCTEFENSGFLNTAFTVALKEQIALTQVDNSLASTGSSYLDDSIKPCHTKYIGPNTNDKVFLLSMQEVTNPNYGFEKAEVGIDTSKDITSSTRAKLPTAFALMNHCQINKNYWSGIWSLRSPAGDGDSDDSGSSYSDVWFSGIGNEHTTSALGEVFEIYAGVVPAICLEY